MRNYFILAPSFHGATLLSLLLSNHSRIVSLGDTLPTLKFDQGCGCGKRVSECEFWSSIRVANPGRGRFHFLPEYCVISKIPAVNLGLLYLFYALGIKRHCADFVDGYRTLTEALAGHRGSAAIFVDGFKSISRYMSCSISGLDASGVIRLVRDPRAFCLSMKKVGATVEDAAKAWCRYYRAVDLLGIRFGYRVVTVSYEALCTGCEETLAEVLAFMGLNREDLQRKVGDDVHWIGNASLINFDGTVTMTNLEKWKQELSVDEIRAVERIAGNRMKRYGYERWCG